MTTFESNVGILDNEDRMTYDPGPSRNSPKFRPTSAPRSFGTLRPRNHPNAADTDFTRFPSDPDRPSGRGNRNRPTSAPVIREDVEYLAPDQQPMRNRNKVDNIRRPEIVAEEQPGGTMDLDRHTLHIIDKLNGKTGRPRRSRPNSAPIKQVNVLGPASGMIRPLSAGVKRAKVGRQQMQLPDCGALRFLKKSNSAPPSRIFAPSTAPQSMETRFNPTWALCANRNNNDRGVMSEDSSFSMRSDANRSSLRGRSASSMRDLSSPSGRKSVNFSTGAGIYPDIPKAILQNPMATKIGRTELTEVNGSFEPLKSQSMIPNYDALYDPFLREFWANKNVSNVMKMTGQTTDQWAPDSGLFESAVSKELEVLSSQRDVSETLLPAPAANPLPFTIEPEHPSGHVISIEVSEEAVSVANEHLALSLSQPVISAWLHWGSLPGQTQPADLDISAVCFDCKARAMESIFFRNLVGKHEAVVHLGDDTDVLAMPEDQLQHVDDDEFNDGSGDRAATLRRKEGIVVHLPRIPEVVQAVVFAVTCYSDESGLSEAVGAEMRLSVGPTSDNGLQNDIVRYYLSSERYNAAAPCMLVRDPRSLSGWSIRTTPRVTVANVVVEMMPVLQAMLRESGACLPYLVQIEYCTARRPTSSLRGRRSDYTNSFKAVALAIRRTFPFIIVQGNPTDSPRIGSFEGVVVDGDRGKQVIWSKIKTKTWPKRMDTVLNRITAAMQAVQVSYDVPDDRSLVEVSVVDAVARSPIAFAVVEVHALGIAAQKLQLDVPTEKIAQQQQEQQQRRGGKQSRPMGKRMYRVQSDARGKLNMRLPGGRYEIWGLSEGYDCEYALEISVRPFSKYKLLARLALAPQDNDR